MRLAWLVLLVVSVTTACVSIDIPSAPLAIRVALRSRQGETVERLPARLAHARSTEALEHVLTLPSAQWGFAPGVAVPGAILFDGLRWELTPQVRPCAVYLVPPLLTHLCDRAEYLAVELAPDALWAFRILDGVVEGRVIRQASDPARQIDVKWSATAEPYPGAMQEILFLDVTLP